MKRAIARVLGVLRDGEEWPTAFLPPIVQFNVREGEVVAGEQRRVTLVVEVQQVIDAPLPERSA